MNCIQVTVRNTAIIAETMNGLQPQEGLPAKRGPSDCIPATSLQSRFGGGLQLGLCLKLFDYIPVLPLIPTRQARCVDHSIYYYLYAAYLAVIYPIGLTLSFIQRINL